MSNLIKHTEQQFRNLGWERGKCEMQDIMMDNLIELLEVFDKQGHSGMSGNYCLFYFDKLARFEELHPDNQTKEGE